MTAARRTELVEAAFRCLADKGFEGLRMRDVAADVGVNIATVHYYFATKEDLVAAVVAHTKQRFAVAIPRDGRPAEQLREHFAALRRLWADQPELTRVLAEITLRAQRDPVVAASLAGNRNTWFGALRGILRRGKADGIWPDIDPDGAAYALMTMMMGACLPGLDAAHDERLTAAFAQLQHWLGGP